MFLSAVLSCEHTRASNQDAKKIQLRATCKDATFFAFLSARSISTSPSTPGT